MLTKRAHLIVSRTYFSPCLFSRELLPSKNNQFRALHSDVNPKVEIEKFEATNVFIKDFGKLSLFTHTWHPFVLKAVSQATTKSKQYVLSSYYGSIANFSINIHRDSFTLKITPIIHIFSNGVINVIFSCYIINTSKFEILHQIVNEIKLSLTKGYKIKGFVIEKHKYKECADLNSLYNKIILQVEESFDLPLGQMTNDPLIVDSMHLNILEYGELPMDNAKDIFTSLCWSCLNRDCNSNFTSKYILESFHGPYFIHRELTAEICKAKYPPAHRERYRVGGWHTYSIIEYAIIDYKIINYLIRHINEEDEVIQDERHRFFPNTMFKPTFYNRYLKKAIDHRNWALDHLTKFQNSLISRIQQAMGFIRNDELSKLNSALASHNYSVDARGNIYKKGFVKIIDKATELFTPKKEI